MISNIKSCCSCCRQYFNLNKYFYIEVRNKCPDYINMTLKYKLNGKNITKPSPTFGPGKIQRIIFPENASNLLLGIFDSSFNPPAIICYREPSGHMINRYKIEGPKYGDLQCVSI